MSNKTRRILFCTGAVLLLVLIAGLMFIVGRGHDEHEQIGRAHV